MVLLLLYGDVSDILLGHVLTRPHCKRVESKLLTECNVVGERLQLGSGWQKSCWLFLSILGRYIHRHTTTIYIHICNFSNCSWMCYVLCLVKTYMFSFELSSMCISVPLVLVVRLTCIRDKRRRQHTCTILNI